MARRSFINLVVTVHSPPKRCRSSAQDCLYEAGVRRRRIWEVSLGYHS